MEQLKLIERDFCKTMNKTYFSLFIYLLMNIYRTTITTTIGKNSFARLFIFHEPTLIILI